VKNPLRILVLEDVAADVVLIDHELRARGLSFQTIRVETREDFERELAHHPPDVILSDHGLPAFDGFSALAIARDRSPETPFIFVTGSMGEEVAIDSLRNGATDYVLKCRLSSLVPAIQRALHLAEERRRRKRAEKELRESEERFRLLVSGVKDYAIFMLDPTGRIASWNAGAELVLGYRAHDVLGESFAMLHSPVERDAGKPAADLSAATSSGRFEEEGWRLRRDGTRFWAHIDLRALHDEQGRLRGFTQVTRDATERRRNEEALRKSEERYRRLVELCPDALLVANEGRLAFANTAAIRLLGATDPAQLLGRPFLDFVPAELRDAAERRWKTLFEPEAAAPANPDGGAGFLEETLARIDGSRIVVEMAAARLTFEDEAAVQLILHDITAQKHAAAALTDSEARKLAILESSLDAVVSIDHRGIVREWNAAAERIFGYTRDEAVGKRLDTLIAPERGARKPGPTLADFLAAGAGNLVGRPVETLARRKRGELFPIDLALTQVPQRNPPFFTAFIRDITDRKRSEEALRLSEARKAAVLETALDAIISIDQEGKIVDWNAAAEKTFGYSRALALGRELADLVAPRSTAELQQKGLARILHTGRGRLLGQRTEAVAMRANGAEFPVELTIARIPGEAPMLFTIFLRDITDRKRTEEALRKSEERFRLLIEGIEDYAIYMLDPHGRITSWNAGAERIDGYRSQEIIGRRFHRFYTPEDCERKKPDQALAVATAEGRYRGECWHVRKNGTRYWANFTITALRDEQGRLYGFSKIARDITQRKEAEDEIRRLNTELERRIHERTAELQSAQQEMEAFSYSISHDLRAPLIHIAGFVEMLRSEIGDRIDEKSRRHLETICGSTEHMGRMIADLLTFSRIGRAELNRVRFNLTDTVRDVQRELQPQLEGRRVTWSVSELPDVWGDPILLRQAVFNLLANAVKFTRPRGEARIEIGAETTTTEHIVFIRDNGVGFDANYAGKLFGVFQRLHPASEFEGTGIGLANTRRILQRHHGRTWAEAKPGAGATFYFSLPIAAPQPT
jgi:PAS domain S-box-containing protein